MECEFCGDRTKAANLDEPWLSLGVCSASCFEALTDAAKDEVERLRADARRYRWLKAQEPATLAGIAWRAEPATNHPGHEPDECIDAAIEAEEKVCPPTAPARGCGTGE